MREPFRQGTPESVGISSAAITWLLDQLESGFTEPHGIMIMRHDVLCAQGWWSPYAPGIRHGEQSHSKTYAATAIGIACTEGILSLDERLIDIFPEEAPAEPSPNLQRLTIRDVLCMGCGMEQEPPSGQHWIRDFLAMPVVHTPGTRFMYNSTGSSMLAAIIRRRTGLSLTDYLTPRLYDKIGIDPTGHAWITAVDDTELGGGGLFATLEDNFRLMRLYRNGGVYNGERILSEEYVREATSKVIDTASEAENNPPAFDNFVGYGYQIWQCQPAGVYRADGAMGQFTIVIPDKDMEIAIMENASGAHWAQRSLDVIWEFLGMVGDEDVLPEDPEAAQRLDLRLRSLSLPRPEFAPYSSRVHVLDGVRYRFASPLRLDRYGIMRGMSERAAEILVDAMQISFDGLSAALHLQTRVPAGGAVQRGVRKQAGVADHVQTDETGRCAAQAGDLKGWIESCETREFTIPVAMDGSRAESTIPEGVVTRALTSAYWQDTETFVIRIRWIETCGEEMLRIHLQENGNIMVDLTGTIAFHDEQHNVAGVREA